MAYEYEKENIRKLNSYNVLSGGANITKPIDELQEVYRKAKAWKELKKYIDEEVDSYMTLYRETKDPAYSLLNSHYDTLLGYMEELERADDER